MASLLLLMWCLLLLELQPWPWMPTSAFCHTQRQSHTTPAQKCFSVFFCNHLIHKSAVCWLLTCVLLVDTFQLQFKAFFLGIYKMFPTTIYVITHKFYIFKYWWSWWSVTIVIKCLSSWGYVTCVHCPEPCACSARMYVRVRGCTCVHVTSRNQRYT